MTVVAVEFDDKVFQDLEEASGAENVPYSQMVSRIVKNYLHAEKISKLRRELRGTAEAAGFFSEEDIYREIS